jgi:hypothetical protein
MDLMTIRARIKPERDTDVRQAAAELFAAVERAQPPNLRYGSCQLADRTYLILLQVADGTENPLPGLPEFHRFQEVLRDSAEGPSVPMPAEIVGGYRLF